MMMSRSGDATQTQQGAQHYFVQPADDGCVKKLMTLSSEKAESLEATTDGDRELFAKLVKVHTKVKLWKPKTGGGAQPVLGNGPHPKYNPIKQVVNVAALLIYLAHSDGTDGVVATYKTETYQSLVNIVATSNDLATGPTLGCNADTRLVIRPASNARRCVSESQSLSG